MRFRKITSMTHYIDYIRVFLILTLVSSALFSYLVYYLNERDIQQDARIEAHHISNEIEKIFTGAHQFMLYIGHQIAAAPDQGANRMATLIGRNSDELSRVHNMPQWQYLGCLGWINLNKHLEYTSSSGTLDKPINMNHRSYLKLTSQTPWELYLSTPTIGVGQGLWQIPGGIGITNHVGKYLGTLAVGFNISTINARLSEHLNEATNILPISFIVIDEHFRIILQSPDNAIDPRTSFFNKNINIKNISMSSEKSLKDPIKYKDIRYIYSLKMKHYPYYIVTGFNKEVIGKLFWEQLLHKIVWLLAIALSCLLVLYIFQQKLIKTARISEKAKQEFISHIKEGMNTSVNCILDHAQVMHNYFNGKIDIYISPEKLSTLIQNIYEAARSLKSFTYNSLKFSLIEPNKTIKECINMHMHSAIISGITIKESLGKYINPLCADEIKFKQIIASFIKLCMDYTPQGGFIKISTRTENIEGDPWLVIIFQDNGFSLSQDDIIRIKNKFSKLDNKHQIEGINLDFSEIDKLVKIHYGIYQIDPQRSQGKTIKLAFPYLSNQCLACSNGVKEESSKEYVTKNKKIIPFKRPPLF